METILSEHFTQVIYHLLNLFNYILFQFFFEINTTTHFSANKSLLQVNMTFIITFRFFTFVQHSIVASSGVTKQSPLDDICD